MEIFRDVVGPVIDAPLRPVIDLAWRRLAYPHLVGKDGRIDREIPHERAIKTLGEYDRSPFDKLLAGRLFTYRDPRLRVSAFGIDFENPTGVAAGFDKNVRAFRALGEMSGTGCVEVGSVTWIPYGGNPRSRVFALPENQALINRMGFPGEGVEAAFARLEENLLRRDNRRYVVGVNIGASAPSFQQNQAVEHYLAAGKKLAQTRADYLVFNLSSPNTPGVRSLQDPSVIAELTSGMQELFRSNPFWRKPILFKLSSDLSAEQGRVIATAALDSKAQGLVIGNTSTDENIRARLTGVHREERGGISGAPIRSKARSLLGDIYRHTAGQLDLVAVGGIFTATDIWRAISYEGASVTQSYTAMVLPETSTPNFFYYLNRDLARMLRKSGVKNLTELRGSGVLRPA